MRFPILVLQKKTSLEHLPGFVTNGGFLKWGHRQITHFHRIFHYKPSMFGDLPFVEPRNNMDDAGPALLWVRLARYSFSPWHHGMLKSPGVQEQPHKLNEGYTHKT